MTNVFSWQNFVIFCPVSFCAPRLNLPVTPGISWLPTFGFQSPIMKRTSFLGVSSKRSQKNWCFWTVVLEKTLESPLDCKKIQPVHPKKDPDAGRDWGQEEKGTTEDEMAGWHHWFNARESEWTPGVHDGQGGLACCDSWGRKELDTTEQLNWTDLFINEILFMSSKEFVHFKLSNLLA